MRELILPARRITRSTPRTRLIEVDLAGHSFPFVAGQAVFAGLAQGSVRRPYSIACSPQQADRNDAIELLVQIDDHNAPDPHLELAEPGTLLKIHGPFGSFSLPPLAADDSLLLIAGGTGIAPLRAMLWDTLETRPGCSIAILYSARTPEEFAFGTELATLAAESRIQLIRTVTRGTGTEWAESTGRISAQLIAPLLRPQMHCVVCGPAALVADATAFLRSTGVDEHRILTETYAA